MGQSDQPTISVIVPAYNRQETLGPTLESLLEQTYDNWEAIVIDDGSVDATAAVAEEYATRDKRISVHRQLNGGVSRARNAAIERARAEWLFFLDADDWIAPRAFERLIAAGAADTQVDAVYGGYARIDQAGKELREKLPVPASDLFPLFARTCAIAIHTCLVRAELVRQSGGFDESLVTCEDWDLWQRLARLGARFAAIPDYIAFYRMRASSASGNGWRMLNDGLLVIERGHGEDPRLAENGSREVTGSESRMLSRTARDAASTYFACYAAGLEIADGHDARRMIDVLGEHISGEVDPHGVAETLFLSVPVGRATDPSEWANFPQAVHRQCHLFIEELGDRLGNHWLAFGARNILERLLLAETSSDERPRTAGRWHLIDLELDGPAPKDLLPDPGVERILCTVRLAGERIDDLEIPVVDGWVPARMLADAVVAPLAWEILQAFFERHVYPTLEVEMAEEMARVSREGRLLFEGHLDPSRTTAQGLHDRIGWTVFLQELWGDTSLSGDEFYDSGRRSSLGRGRRLTVRSECVEVDIAEALPMISLRGHSEITVVVKISGAPLTVVRCKASHGRISSRQLRRTILLETGYELCRAVLREAVILAPADATGSLRERLARALAVNRESTDRSSTATTQEQITVVGRAGGTDGTAASRWAVVPVGAAEERLSLARLEGNPILGASESNAVGRLLCTPLVLNPAGREERLSDDSLLRSMEFECIYGARHDPWAYDSPYEQTKYEQTLKLLPEHADRVLEIGCAEGVFTRKLSERVNTVTAVDISLLAITRAARHCAGCANVVFKQMDALDGAIDGAYDLIVCSELLYYADGESALKRTVKAMVEALEPGGYLLTAHAHVLADDPQVPGFDWDVPFGAAAIERALLATRALDLAEEIKTPAYRVQLYARRRALRRMGSGRRRVKGTLEHAGALNPEHATRFLADGGQVRREPSEPETPVLTRMPILMYHRVAPEGGAVTKRWRVHPDDFEAQLRYLRDHKYNSLTFEQWRVASDRRQPLPGRSVMLTFDDGYQDFIDHALPLLNKYGFQATMFIVTDLVGASNVWDDRLEEPLALMDWPTIRELPSHGVELGSHTSRHLPLVSLSAAELTRDLCRSRLSFHENLNMTVRSVCYPYGLHDATVLSMAGASGFHYGVTTNEWQASFGDDLLSLPRLEVRGTDTFADFVVKLNE
jgi:peptidoglycan/xylan/chitin deacetylase (PgdA/CDA1 family)/SAM-dependent methyltransferase